MTDDPFMKLVDIALNHVSTHANNSDRLARAIYGLIEGDDPEDAAQLLQELGYTDEDGFWIDEGEE
jgi:hypothetical protein